jgi:hypothetical protein
MTYARAFVHYILHTLSNGPSYLLEHSGIGTPSKASTRSNAVLRIIYVCHSGRKQRRVNKTI